jgi:O-antigen ligase
VSLQKMLSYLMMTVLVAVLVFQFTPAKTLERITNLPFTQGGEQGLGAGSLERRQYTWEIALEIYRQNPVLGVGIGNWDLARFLEDPTHSIGAPHSSYFLALCEGGFFCLLAYLVLLWRCWRNIRFAEAEVSDPNSPLASVRWIVMSAKTDFVVLIFFSLFADLWQLVILFWLVGIGIVMRRMCEQVLQEESLEEE